MKIVFAGVDDDRAWGVGNDDAVGVEDGVGEIGAAEAAVQDRGERKIGRDRRPFTNRGAANENHRAQCGRLGGIGRGEGVDLRRPILRGGINARGEQERGDEKSTDQ